MSVGPSGPSGPVVTGGGGPTGATGILPGVPPDVQDFLNLLDSPAFNIQQPISEPEANEAIALFSVINVMLGGQSVARFTTTEQTDVLGILTLFYGVPSQGARKELGLSVDWPTLWPQIQGTINDLKSTLVSKLRDDADQLLREAKRQFNLGRNNDVPGNTTFPRLFHRYVDLVNDPLLTMDIKLQQQNPFTDKQQIGQALEVLRDLKDVILQIVRSLSDYGNVALNQYNQDWADFEFQALKVLQQVGTNVLSENNNDKNPWAVLSKLTRRDRDKDIAPHVVLGRDGGALLTLAMDVYRYEIQQSFLDRDDDTTVLDIFQHGNDANQYMTTIMRGEASLVKRYPVANWAG